MAFVGKPTAGAVLDSGCSVPAAPPVEHPTLPLFELDLRR